MIEYIMVYYNKSKTNNFKDEARKWKAHRVLLYKNFEIDRVWQPHSNNITFGNFIDNLISKLSTPLQTELNWDQMVNLVDSVIHEYVETIKLK